jgi:uncharacterized integral membrane protein
MTKQILGWVLVALLCVFVGFNLTPARIWFFGIKVEMPIALAVLFSALLGAGVFWAFTRLAKRKK